MKKSSILLFLISLLFVGCGPSTKLTMSWANEDVTPKSYEKLAVVSLTPNSSSRYLMERAMVADFIDDGIKAIPTYEIFPMADRISELEKLVGDAEELKRRVTQKVTDNGIDAITLKTI